MKDYFDAYGSSLSQQWSQQWQSLDWSSKCLTVFVGFILLTAGLFTGLFVFSASLLIALAVALKSMFAPSHWQVK